ncbi:hypothetical protein ACSS6W_002278 [Trichoderma asperelloides]|uniref:Uncharacterized protein n=1 Tax=Trichoderma asperellum TaxID=101201 RepID=A0A6V8QRP6_TRIAP|nr:hypothetical protein LI328DRAFT_129192 [Trichoderma asperelloides]GFP54476.1 hypothetical protein TASIC1_0004010000 [Trichoderma asperellum]
MASDRSMELLRDELIRRARGDGQADAAADRNQILAERRRTMLRDMQTEMEPDTTRRFPRRLLLPRLALGRRRGALGDEEAALESPKTPVIQSRQTNSSPLSAPQPARLAGAPGANGSPEPMAPPYSEAQRQADKREKKKKFLFCFPFIKSRHVRMQIAQCFVAATFLFSLLAVYLGITLTNHAVIGELNIMLIMIILLAAVFFCYSLVRLWMLIARGDPPEVPRAIDPRGYAVPRKPIRVVMAQDEEAAGVESEAVRMKPPAYGLWRESVRVDPNRFFWQRNEAAQAPASRPTTGPRPPSYASDDGVSYVVEAVPRSIAPSSSTSEPQPVHPSERGRAGQPPPN